MNDELNTENSGKAAVDTPAAPGASVGQRLREAREAAGLSLEEVAIRLRLRLEWLRALEEDDFASLPPMAFVAGYLRSYARLLGLPAEELTSRLERREKEAVVMPVLPPSQRRAGDWPVKVVTYLVVLLLIVLLGVWWYTSQPVEEDTFTALTPPAAPGEAVELTLPAADDVELEAEIAVDGADTVEAGAAGEMSAADGVVTAEPPAVAEEESAVPSVIEIRLEAASGDCWVSIKDATGKQLIYELVPQGGKRTVSGTAPFSVFLGYAPAMKVYYQGQEFDHSAYLRGDVARFRLGKATDNRPVTE